MHSPAHLLGGQHTLAREAMSAITHLKCYRHWYQTLEYFNSRLDDIWYIGFQETMAADYEQIKARLKLPENAHLPDDDIAAHRTPPNLDQRIDPLGLEALNDWYAEDILFYQRCRELMMMRH